MANVFKPKRSSTASSVPTTSNLADGELAVNSADQKIYLRDGNSIVEVANASGGSSGISNVVEDTTPQLGGDLDLNSNNITGTGNIDITGTLDVSGITTFQNNVKLLDSDTLSFGTDSDFRIGHYFGTNAIAMVSGNLSFTDSSSNERLKLTNNGNWEIKDNQATTRVTVTTSGATVTGALVAGGLTYPSSDGTNGQVLTTNGQGTLSFTTVGGSSGISNVVEDTTPQLGGNLQSNGNDIILADSDQLKLGSGSFDFTATHNGTDTLFQNYVGDLYIGTRGGEWTGDDIIIESADDFEVRINASTNVGSGITAIYATGGGSVKLNHNGSTKFETISTGATVTGDLYATNFYGDGSNLTNVASATNATNASKAYVNMYNSVSGGTYNTSRFIFVPDGLSGYKDLFTERVSTCYYHADSDTIHAKINAESLIVKGSIDSGATDYAGYRSDGTNIILKGDSVGRSGIFFESEKDGTNINHPSDYGYIQYHAYGIDGSTGEANKLVIGVANDSTDTVVLQSPYANGVKISYKNSTSGTGGSEYTVWHAGNDGASSGLDADLLDGQQGSYYLDYNNFTNTPSVVSTSSANTFTASQTISTGKVTNPNNDDPSTYDRLLFDNSHNSTAEGPNKIQLYNDSANNWSAGFGVHSDTMAYYSGDYHRFYDQTGAQGNSANFTELLAFNSSNLTYKSNTIWHSGNDGAGSGLDADRLDGQQGSYYIDTSNTDQTKAGRLTLGSTNGNNEGLSIQHAASSTGYGAIRGYDNTTNNSAIHFFSNSWTSGGTTSGVEGSQGCINLSGSYGVTIGDWNNPEAYVQYNVLGVRGDGSSTRGSLKLFRNNNTYAVSLAASNALATNYTFALPTGTGSAGQVLATDGTAATYWTTVSTAIIADDAVTYAKMQNVSATDRILGRDSAGAGVIEELTPAAVRTMINVADGATAYSNSNVDAHLNQSNPTSGYVLSWNGSDYAWVAQSGGGISNVVEDTTPELGGALDMDGSIIYSGASGLGGTYGDMALEPITTSYGSVNGGLKIRCRDKTAGTTYYQYYFDGANLSTPGSITASGNVTAYSDIRLKKDIKPIENALDKISKINGVTFQRTDLETEERFAGVIAQEVEKVLPEVVNTDEKGIKSVSYGNMVALLIEAVKEQQQEINKLKEELGK